MHSKSTKKDLQIKVRNRALTNNAPGKQEIRALEAFFE